MSNVAGRIGWLDLTVDDADTVRDFYRAVIGWEADSVDMGGYSDYVMRPPGTSDGVAGVCHARGSNADIPPLWLVYLTVDDVAESAAGLRRTLAPLTPAASRGFFNFDGQPIGW